MRPQDYSPVMLCAAERRRGHAIHPNYLTVAITAHLLACAASAASAAAAGAAEAPASAPSAETFAVLAATYAGEVRPLVENYCLGCHDAETKKGELDLERFGSLEAVRRDPEVWQKVVEQLRDGEMPPAEKKQPSAAERRALAGWARRYLDAEALSRAGDPGPVVLRRLSNAEYRYVVRDLTGVPGLDPTQQFPVDAAAGEGFTNTGQAMGMSPALLTKYLDAGKAVAAHLVLLPDGFRFSGSTSRRDWSNEVLERIRALYLRHTGGGAIDFSYRSQVGAVEPRSAAEGRLDPAPYFEALIAHRETLTGGAENGPAAGAVAGVAGAAAVNPKYLGILAAAFLHPSAPGDAGAGPLLVQLRRRLADAPPGGGVALAAAVRAWQDQLWTFNKVGHLGAIRRWQEPVDPLSGPRGFRLKLPAGEAAGEITVRLVAGSAGDGDGGGADLVVWQNPRIVRPGKPPLALRDARAAAAVFASVKGRVLGGTADYLAAVWEARRAGGDGAAFDPGARAAEDGLEPAVLKAWLAYLGVGGGGEVAIDGYLAGKVESVRGYSFVQGWTIPGVADLSLVGNASDNQVQIPGDLPAHRVVVHPRPERWIAAGWKSPIDAEVRLEVLVHHRHNACGNGVSWSLQHRRGAVRRTLQSGHTERGGKADARPVDGFSVRRGDLVSVVVSARDRSHVCDLTEIDLVVREARGEGRRWSLAGDCADDMLAGNPHPDRLGNADVWHFYSGLEDDGAPPPEAVPPGSLLARWLEAEDPAGAARLAAELQRLLSGPPAPGTPAADAALHRQVTAAGGPLFSSLDLGELLEGSSSNAGERELAGARFGLSPDRFGPRPGLGVAGRGDLLVRAPSVLEFQLPSDLFGGAELVVTGALREPAGRGGEGSAQVAAEVAAPGTPSPGAAELLPGIPVSVVPGGPAEARVKRAFAQFRELFPAALSYSRIVPIDETVTLVLYHREDEPLRRLMLEPGESAELDRLWDELHYISQDAFATETALEQILEFATQDADPKRFFPLREPVRKAAVALRRTLDATEPAHLDALVAFAARGYRRPLESAEAAGLRALYGRLRAEEIPHEQAVRLTLARVFASPAFLYRLEEPGAGEGPSPVAAHELATRLSFFLWSSVPDVELRAAADSGQLVGPDAAAAQARRMLRDGRVRRLAVQFACQWLHIRGFDRHDEKSERHFPTFKDVRANAYEESVRFFTDLFQNDRSVLSILDADYTFLNPELARHYGIPGVEGEGEGEGEGWRRVEGMGRFGRGGGVLAHTTTLAVNSGASRTSPILRGNWVYETLLGQRLPRPPPDVPQLPAAVPEGLTARQLIERHSADPACARCHARIDPYGFALEGFDAIGRRRPGAAPDTRTALPDGAEIDGLPGLRDYLLEERRGDVVRQFCRKLLGYALGRAVQLSDQPLLEEMAGRLEADGYRFSAAVDAVVRSPQFLQIRGRGARRRGE